VKVHALIRKEITPVHVHIPHILRKMEDIVKIPIRARSIMEDAVNCVNLSIITLTAPVAMVLKSTSTIKHNALILMNANMKTGN
jgi:hypothetical protein